MQSLVVHLSADPDFRSFRVSVLIGRADLPHSPLSPCRHHRAGRKHRVSRNGSTFQLSGCCGFIATQTGRTRPIYKQQRHLKVSCRLLLSVSVSVDGRLPVCVSVRVFIFVRRPNGCMPRAANRISIRFATGQFLFYDLFCRLDE